jgi:hypothetical protein
VTGVELAVHQRMQHGPGLFASHFICSCSAIHAERSMARARARRDITVPTGAPTVCAISRQERLLISRSTKVSRRFGKRVDQLADRSCVTRLQYLGFRGLLRLVPERGLFGVIGHLFYPARRQIGAPGVFGAADVA